MVKLIYESILKFIVKNFGDAISGVLFDIFK